MKNSIAELNVFELHSVGGGTLKNDEDFREESMLILQSLTLGALGASGTKLYLMGQGRNIGLRLFVNLFMVSTSVAASMLKGLKFIKKFYTDSSAG